MRPTREGISVPKQDICRKAYRKWEARMQAGDLRLHDWLQAEAELVLVGDLARKLAEVKKQLRDSVSVGNLATKRLGAEHAIGEILREAAEFRDAAAPILRTLCKCLGWDVGVFWLVDRSAAALRCLDFWSRSTIEVTAFEQAVRERVFAIGESLPGRIWVEDTLLWIPDIISDADVLFGAVGADAGLHGAVGFPVRNGAEHLGVMTFFSNEVRAPDESLIGMMTSISCQISQFIERRYAEHDLRVQEDDRRIGRQIQQGLLPKCMPAVPGFRISGRSATANTVGGDNFDFIPIHVGGQEGLGIMVGDASGHGIGAALLMAHTRAFVRALALTCGDVGNLLTLTNRRLASDIVSDHFVTLFLSHLSPDGSFTYSSAGHWPGYLLDRRGATRAILPSTGIPLGINADEAYTAPPALSLEPGELVLLVTDGVVEAVSSDGTTFGAERTLAIVQRHQQETPDEILDALFGALAHACKNTFFDDLTAVVIQAVS